MSGLVQITQLNIEAKYFRDEVSSILENEDDRAKLFEALRLYHETHKIKKLIRDLKIILNSEKRHPLFKEIRSLILPEDVAIYDKLSAVSKNSERLVRIKRIEDESMGFSFRGGLEHGIGFYVTSVKPGTAAHIGGLKVCDEIRKINGLPLYESIHNEVLAILKSKNQMTLLVKHVGRVPSKTNNHITWTEVEVEEPIQSEEKVVKVHANGVTTKRDRLLAFQVGKEGLGCSIRSGIKGHTGIYIAAVANDSLSEQVGLKVGDQILDINGKDFVRISHEKAVNYLRDKTHLTMIVRHSNVVKEIIESPRKTKEGILITEPKHSIIRQSVRYGDEEIIYFDMVEELVTEDDDVVIPGPLNFQYPDSLLQGRDVHYVPIAKNGSLAMDLACIDGKIVVKSLSRTGFVAWQGFIRAGDWILNVEGYDLVDVTADEANEFITEAMSRWSKYIEFIVACPAGRLPCKLPTKKATSEIVRDANFSIAHKIVNDRKDSITRVMGAIANFENKTTIVQRERNFPRRRNSLDQMQVRQLRVSSRSSLPSTTDTDTKERRISMNLSNYTSAAPKEAHVTDKFQAISSSSSPVKKTKPAVLPKFPGIKESLIVRSVEKHTASSPRDASPRVSPTNSSRDVSPRIRSRKIISNNSKMDKKKTKPIIPPRRNSLQSQQNLPFIGSQRPHIDNLSSDNNEMNSSVEYDTVDRKTSVSSSRDVKKKDATYNRVGGILQREYLPNSYDDNDAIGKSFEHKNKSKAVLQVSDDDNDTSKLFEIKNRNKLIDDNTNNFLSEEEENPEFGNTRKKSHIFEGRNTPTLKNEPRYETVKDVTKRKTGTSISSGLNGRSETTNLNEINKNRNSQLFSPDMFFVPDTGRGETNSPLYESVDNTRSAHDIWYSSQQLFDESKREENNTEEDIGIVSNEKNSVSLPHKSLMLTKSSVDVPTQVQMANAITAGVSLQREKILQKKTEKELVKGYRSSSFKNTNYKPTFYDSSKNKEMPELEKLSPKKRSASDGLLTGGRLKSLLTSYETTAKEVNKPIVPVKPIRVLNLKKQNSPKRSISAEDVSVVNNKSVKSMTSSFETEHGLKDEDTSNLILHHDTYYNRSRSVYDPVSDSNSRIISPISPQVRATRSQQIQNDVVANDTSTIIKSQKAPLKPVKPQRSPSKSVKPKAPLKPLSHEEVLNISKNGISIKDLASNFDNGDNSLETENIVKYRQPSNSTKTRPKSLPELLNENKDVIKPNNVIISPTGKEIKSILTTGKKGSPKKVQFSNFVSVSTGSPDEKQAKTTPGFQSNNNQREVTKQEGQVQNITDIVRSDKNTDSQTPSSNLIKPIDIPPLQYSINNDTITPAFHNWDDNTLNTKGNKSPTKSFLQKMKSIRSGVSNRSNKTQNINQSNFRFGPNNDTGDKISFNQSFSQPPSSFNLINKGSLKLDNHIDLLSADSSLPRDVDSPNQLFRSDINNDSVVIDRDERIRRRQSGGITEFGTN